ncbi:MAG: lactate utilization protein [Candidatus Thiodiazotropha sp.]
MTSSSKQAILQRLRRKQPSFDTPSQPIDIEHPTWPMETRITQFKSMLESVRAEVHVVDSKHWTDSLKTLLADKQIDNLLYGKQGPLSKEIETAWGDTLLPKLVCDERPVDEWKEEIFFHTDAVVTSSRAAIAETGSLVLWPDEFEPRTWSLVPPVHFVVVDSNKLYNNFAEVVEAEQWAQQMPTNALLISGPSKSADIQQTLAYGVHGPVELIVLLRQHETNS